MDLLPALMVSPRSSKYFPTYTLIINTEAQSKYGVTGAQAFYYAARIYNSGSIPDSTDLGNADGATACYVSDVANRLTGWVTADSTCTDSNAE